MFDYTLTQVEVWADDASNFRIRCVGEDVHDEHDIHGDQDNLDNRDNSGAKDNNDDQDNPSGDHLAKMLLKVCRLCGCSPNIGPLHFVTSSVVLRSHA